MLPPLLPIILFFRSLSLIPSSYYPFPYPHLTYIVPLYCYCFYACYLFSYLNKVTIDRTKLALYCIGTSGDTLLSFVNDQSTCFALYFMACHSLFLITRCTKYIIKSLFFIAYQSYWNLTHHCQQHNRQCIRCPNMRHI